MNDIFYNNIVFRKYKPLKDSRTLNRDLFTKISLEDIIKDDLVFIEESERYHRFIVEDSTTHRFIGTVTLIIDPPNTNGSTATIGRIYSVFIREDHRKKGIATYMLNQLILFAKKIGLKELYISTWEDNTSAILLYQKVGFKFVAEGEKRKKENENINQKELIFVFNPS